MKRADLVAGAEYLACRSNDWQTSYNQDRVTVVTTDPRQYEGSGWHPRRKIVAATKSNLVHVRVTTLSEEHPGFLVPLTQIRGPWDEAHAESEQWKEARARRYEAAQKQSDRATREMQLAAERASSFGLDPSWSRSDSTTRISLPAAQLDAILQLLPPDWTWSP